MKRLYILLSTAFITSGFVALQPLFAQIPLAWTARYNAPPDQADESRSLAVDNSGNVYVTGSGFNSSGNLDIITVKYDTDGNQIWVKNYDRGINDNDEGKKLTLDNSGNIYVTGYSRGNGTSLDVVTIKYDPQGNELWASHYNGSANGMDEGKAISVDGSGNVYVCGYESDANFFFDAITIKYNSSGTQQWIQTIAGAAGENDELTSIATDASGNIYVTGYEANSTNNNDYLTVKYNGSGTQQWQVNYNGPSNSNDYGRSLTLDNSGNVLVTGYSFENNNWFDMLTVKYTSAGTQLWTARYNNGANRYEEAWDVITDQAGFVYVTGQSQAIGNNSTPPDCATIKYTPNGNQLWVKRYDGGTGNDDRAFAIALDDTANVYITGYSMNATNFDYITIKYDSSGTEEWAMRYNGTANQGDQSLDIVVKDGDVYITGKSANPTNDDFLTIKYSYSAVGIEENPGVITLNTFPVPSTDRLNVIIPSTVNTADLSVRIMSITGELVAQPSVLNSGNSVITVDLQGLAAGNYIISVIDRNNSSIFGSALFVHY